MKKFLEKLIAAKKKKAEELRSAIKAAESADEVRALGDTLQAVLDELREAEEKLADLDKDDQGAGNPADEGRGANPMHEFRQVDQVNPQRRQQDEDPTNSVEYRTAFMNYVCRGTAIPMELRNEFTMTADAAAVIPTTILHEIVKEMKGYGEIWQRVRHLNVQGGVNIPILDLKPTASWIGEDAASADQKISAKESVVFNYYGLECKIAQSLLVNITTLDMFQREFTALAAEAMVQAVEVAIFTGDGNGKPLGILNDTRVPAKNKVTLTAEEFGNWSAWKKKVFAKMKKAYRKGSFVMAQGTFDGYIDGMVDQNGQPIGRVNYGIADAEAYRFGGKEVLTAEEDIVADYDSAEVGAVVAVFVNLPDYGVNTNLQMQVVKWTDHDNNKIKNKAIMICDGKLIDPNSVILVVKG